MCLSATGGCCMVSKGTRLAFVLAHFLFSDSGEICLAFVLFPTRLERKKWVVATSPSLKAAP